MSKYGIAAAAAAIGAQVAKDAWAQTRQMATKDFYGYAKGYLTGKSGSSSGSPYTSLTASRHAAAHTTSKKTRNKIPYLTTYTPIPAKAFDLLVYNSTTNLGTMDSLTYGAFNTAYTGYTHLNVIAQGSTSSARIGNRINMKSIHFRANFYDYCTASSGSFVTVRTLLVFDAQPNGSAPAIATIFASQPVGGTAFHSGVHPGFLNRYQILRDDEFALTMDHPVHLIDWYVHGNYPVEFTSSTSTIGDIICGALYWISCVGKVYTSSTYAAAYTTDAMVRLKYTD